MCRLSLRFVGRHASRRCNTDTPPRTAWDLGGSDDPSSTRPAPRFKEGAVPTALNLPFPAFDKLARRLPVEESTLVVFYCSGVTCSMSSGAQKKAKALRYTNVKVFVEGMPAWYAKHYGALTAESLRSAYRDVPHVLIDARVTSAAERESSRPPSPGPPTP